MASVTFSTGFHLLKPGLRVSGDEISTVYRGVYDTGLYKGKKYIHIDLTNEPDLTLVEAGVSGPLDTVADVDALYTQLKDAGMTEVFPDFMVDPSDLSIIEVGNQQISFDFAGHAPYIFGRNSDPAATERVKVANQTWTLPQSDFAGAVTLFTDMESPEEIEFRSIEDRLNGQETEYEGLVAAEAAVREANDNTIIASVASEASTREAADDALSGRLDTLESDPTTAAAVAAGDAATLSSANAYTDTKVADVIGAAPGVLDTLGEIADAINDDANVYTTLVTQISDEATARENADNALDARITTIEDAPYATDAGVTIVAQDIRTDFEADDAAERSSRIDGDNALSARLDVLETDPITNAAVVTIANDLQNNRIQGDQVLRVDFEADDAALSTRIDALEADPTTKTYVDTQDALALPKAGAVVSVGSDVTFRYGDKLIIDSAVELNLWSDGDVKVVADEDYDILLSTQGTGKVDISGDINVGGNFVGQGSFTCGSLFVPDIGSFSSPALPDNVSFADLMEAIGDALLVRPKLDGSNIPGPYADDAAAATGGVAVGAIYKHNNGQIHYRVS